MKVPVWLFGKYNVESLAKNLSSFSDSFASDIFLKFFAIDSMPVLSTGIGIIHIWENDSPWSAVMGVPVPITRLWYQHFVILVFVQDEGEQRRLEEQHRAEEERLYREFKDIRLQEEEKAIKGIQEEWEVELTRLTAKFERDLQMKTKNKDEQKVLTLKYAKEKESFEKNMTLKREKKKESVTKKLLEQGGFLYNVTALCYWKRVTPVPVNLKF